MRASSNSKSPFANLFKILLAIAVPVGVIAVANLPIPLIRRPVAQNMSFLLLPSYIGFEQDYRGAIASVAQAEQLISRATGPDDFRLGKEQLKKAQTHLDALPLDFLQEYPDCVGYRWQFNALEFDRHRAKIAQLEAVVFQEENADTLLSNLQNTLATAKQEYQQANTPEAKTAALDTWRSSLTQLGQIPRQTLAGKNAYQQLQNEQGQFREVVGESATQDRASVIIDSAKQYAWQAAIASQNPPHPAVKWQQIETLWQQAIYELEAIKPDAGEAYRTAQTLRAQYTNNLGQAKIRRQTEKDSFNALESAQTNIERLLALTPTNSQQINYASTAAQLQKIVNNLDKVAPGTTSYAKATELKQFAQAKLQEIQSAVGN
jgi:bacterioferritin (cytochrome b1)